MISGSLELTAVFSFCVARSTRQSLAAEIAARRDASRSVPSTSTSAWTIAPKSLAAVAEFKLLNFSSSATKVASSCFAVVSSPSGKATAGDWHSSRAARNTAISSLDTASRRLSLAFAMRDSCSTLSATFLKVSVNACVCLCACCANDASKALDRARTASRGSNSCVERREIARVVSSSSWPKNWANTSHSLKTGSCSFRSTACCKHCSNSAKSRAWIASTHCVLKALRLANAAFASCLRPQDCILTTKTEICASRRWLRAVLTEFRMNTLLVPVWISALFSCPLLARLSMMLLQAPTPF
mmetsp:Transcript_41252/g.80901  ORF Transcript_41252/g.80901 Transcript_41252/m.80901 type:complete len:300 (-) Transcript_41252:377-1276(-)